MAGLDMPGLNLPAAAARILRDLHVPPSALPCVVGTHAQAHAQTHAYAQAHAHARTPAHARSRARARASAIGVHDPRAPPHAAVRSASQPTYRPHAPG